MPFLISSTQSAFLKGRVASQNIILANEVLHSFKKKLGSKGWAMVKVDFNKSYDRWEWSFVSEVLHKFGFPGLFIDCLKLCFTDVSYQVLLNGVPSSIITPTRGLRQGDPFSHYIYIYILCMEMFSLNIKYLVELKLLLKE